MQSELKYLRPVTDGSITNTLFIGNAGDAVGLSPSRISQLCSEGRVDVPDPAKSFLFVTFAHPEQATEAMSILQDEEIVGRALTVKYANRHPKFRTKPCDEVCIPVFQSAEDIGIPGLYLYRNFVTEEEEQTMHKHLDDVKWSSLAKRQVCHFGYEFDYLTRTVSMNSIPPIPEFCEAVRNRIEELPEVEKLDQLTIKKYPAGVGLSPHVDAHSAFTGSITSLSLGSSAVMEFRREGYRKAIELPPRSLLVMSGECRYAWEHYIPHRKSDNVNGTMIRRGSFRISLTFRQARGFPCSCSYPNMCDSQSSTLPPTRKLQLLQQDGQASTLQGNHDSQMPSVEAKIPAKGLPTNGEPALEVDKLAEQVHDSHLVEHGALGSLAHEEADNDYLRKLEEKYVHRVYDAIAPHFSATRFATWPAVKQFLGSLPHGAVIADVGCGNGKYLAIRPDIAVLASDNSVGLVKLAQNRIRKPAPGAKTAPGTDVFVADGMTLPYRHGSCDAVICIAVLHHITSHGRRQLFLRRLRDVLAPGGRAMVTVWALEQEEPKCTLDKWTPIDVDSCAKDTRQQARSQCNTSRGETSAKQPLDFFVPWHLPFHRAEAHLAVAKAAEGESSETNAPVGVLDHNKKTVVFNRYYHVFAEGELHNLVASIEGVHVVDTFYDASNWVVVFERIS